MPSVADPYSFSHLLGLTLAGGRRAGPQTLLVVVLPEASAHVVSGAVASVSLTATDRPVRWVRPGSGGADELRCEWDGWPELLPPAPPPPDLCSICGLAPWQQAAVEREPHAFVRGLLEAGGRRTEQRVTNRLGDGTRVSYDYARWLLTSSSSSVRALLCEGCERIGVRWTRSRPRTISVAERTSVRLLDDFVGDPVA